MNEKRKITDEEKRQLAKLFKGLIPNGTLDEDDILWIMNEVENGNRDVSFEDFVKAKKERHDKFAAKKSEEPHFCFRCKHQTCKPDEEPCKSCSEWPHHGSLTMDSKWEPKEDKEYEKHLCKDCKFVDDPVFEEPCSSCFVFDRDNGYYHKNWQPIPDKSEEDEIETELEERCCNCKHSGKAFIDEPCKTCIRKGNHKYFEKKDIVDAKDKVNASFGLKNYKSNIVIPQLGGVEKKIDKLTEALESVNSKLDILDQRAHDLRKHLILKEMKCITQVKEAEKDILEKLNNIEQVVMKNSIGINTTYEKASAVHDEVCKDETKDIYVRPAPKFKVGDIVKVSNDTKHRDFFVCVIKWSDRSHRWIYLLSEKLEDISEAFWKYDDWISKSDDHGQPLFKVGDKVKLKAGKTVYTVLSVTHFMCGDRKVYRYRISHSATTPHYENEDRLIKA